MCVIEPQLTLVQLLSNNDMNINLGVLETAHSIFREWCSRARSDAFWPIIKLVHSKFLVPYFQLFELTSSLPSRIGTGVIEIAEVRSITFSLLFT
jgi:hypothetical protein